MSVHAYYFDQPAVQASMTPGAQFYNVILHDPSPDEAAQEVTMNRRILPQLESLEARNEIKGTHLWPWIAAHLTGNGCQPTEEIARHKLNILLDAICLQGRVYGRSFEEFRAPTFTGPSAIHITPAHMQRWYTKLESIDLWYLGIESGRLSKLLSIGFRDQNVPPTENFISPE